MSTEHQRLAPRLLLASLCATLTAVVLSGAVLANPSPASVVQTRRPATRFDQIVVARTLSLRAGVTTRSFAFTIHADYPDQVVLIVSRSAAVTVKALSASGRDRWRHPALDVRLPPPGIA